MASISILGDGAFGTAMAVLLGSLPGNQTTLWKTARPETAAILRDKRENIQLLPGIRIPDYVRLTADPQEAVAKTDLLISAIPTIHLRSTLQRFSGLIPKSLPVLSLTKGIEQATFLRPSEIIHQILGVSRIAVLSGPSHAEEVAQGKPTSVVIAATENSLADAMQEMFPSERFRVYTNSDCIGVELCGALKNVLAIAAGICDGLGSGDNAKAALLTRGLVEMARFGMAHGADHSTFQGLAGIGDLITTCYSPHGRNRKVGEQLGRGQKLAEILAGSPKISEGVTTARSVFERTRQMGLDVPVMTGVYRVLYENLPPRDAVSALMSRPQRKEGS